MGGDRMSARAGQLHRFVSELQVIAGDMLVVEPAVLLERCVAWAGSWSPRTRSEQLVFDWLLRSTWRHLCAVVTADTLPLPEPLNAEQFQVAVKSLCVMHGQGIPARVALALEIMRRRHGEPTLTAAAVARELRVSMSHLTRELKRHTGLGFRQHLRAIRIARAKELLADATLSIKEIAAAAGYSSASNLDRQFRSVVGRRPSAARGPGQSRSR